MTVQEIQSRIEKLSQGTRAQVVDLTGTSDHIEAEVDSPAFSGKSMIEQHQMIYALFKPELQSGELHALKLKTRATPVK